MTATDIKKAWTLFKKEIARELDLDLTGCCYMNAKQIANGTATITLDLDWSYDDEIAYELREVERVSSWDGDNKERGERIARQHREKIAVLEARKAAHGTRENETRGKVDLITGSAAFKKLAATIGIKSADLVRGKYSSNLNTYQIRICY